MRLDVSGCRGLWSSVQCFFESEFLGVEQRVRRQRLDPLSGEFGRHVVVQRVDRLELRRQ